ncbi:MAG TPA: adenylate/guanylate cyclase domain-containing protein [Mycobacteriales bacterium]|nr:adenylate/guanylate cyclase domain-containing protein [Mycobacteriales bacterium]
MSAGPPLACPVCGTPTVPAAHFCFQCGAALQGLSDLHSDHGAERRVVTVLFGDLSDFTAWAEDLDPERVGVVTDRLLASLTDAVTAFGGHVDKLTGDGIMAIFGAPTAHEDDAERAVRAAMQMQDELGRLVAEESGGGRQLGLRVGLNTGEVLAGVRAGVSYTVVGDTVNTASRLSDAAGVGAVVAGQATVGPTLAIASWRALPPLRLKGKRDPVVAYELIALRRRTATRLGLGDEAPLTGREAELGLLVSRVRDSAERRTPTTLLLTGAAGVGKTRLWRELARVVAEMPGSRVLVGRCPPYGRARDLAPIVEMVRTACGVGDDDDDAVARGRVVRLVSRLDHPARARRGGGMLTETLLNLLGLGDVDLTAPREAAPPGEQGGRGESIAAALAGLFSALAGEGPLLLVVDDLQWSGRGLLDLLTAVASQLDGAVTMLAVGRQELVEKHEDWSPRLPDPVLLPLAPLEEPAADRLLRAYLGGSELAGSARRMLLDRAQGNPFFLAELLHLLIDRGLLRREDEGWVVTGDLPERVLPAGVHAVLAARIDALPAAARATLRAAAVVGNRFWTGALVALTGRAADEVRQHLSVLVDHDVVRSAGGDAWSFTHALTREVAYAGVAKVDRAREHALVAHWAVRELTGSPAEVDVAVAAQAELAANLAREMSLPVGDPAWLAAEVGVLALVRLGRTSLARDDNISAVELLGRATALGTDSVSAAASFDAGVAYADALARVHRLDEALVALAPALAAADLGVLAGALAVQGDVRRKQGDDKGATESFVRALAAASEVGDDRLVAEALRQLGLLDFFAGRLPEAEERFTQALELARRVRDPRGTGWALQHLAWSATTRGDYARADETLRAATAVFAEFDDDRGVAWCAGTEALVRMLQGRLGEAKSLVRVLIDQTRAHGNRWAAGACLTIDAIASSELGNVTLAVERGRQAHLIFTELADSWGTSLALVARGMAARAGGSAEEAVLLLSESALHADRHRHPSVGTLALVTLGWCHYEAQRLDDAEAAVRRSLELAGGLGLEPQAATGERVLLALIARARGDLPTALRTLHDVTRTPASSTLLFPMRQAVAHYAATLLQAGRLSEALAQAELALSVPAEDVRSTVIAHRAYGAALAATGRRADAEQALRTACRVAESTEHVREREVTQRALADFLAGAAAR